MIQAAYIHIPFCEQICFYCDFNKVFLKNQPVEEYIDSVLKELDLTKGDKQKPFQLKTIYIGGGTPTALSAGQLERLLQGIQERVAMEQVEEFTVEVNPDNATMDRLNVLKKYGVNRLSIGVQTFDEVLLKAIGRTHVEENIYKAIENSRKAGFENISIDLMFGLPQQTPEQFKITLQKAFELGVEHISAYSLKIEEKTVFFNRQRKGKLQLPPEDDEVKMYELLREQTSSNGFVQYEISNFAKPGYESKHNLVYWNNEEYYAFGAGAHGYVSGVRHHNHGPLPKYLKAVACGELPRLQESKVSLVEKIEEEMFLGLRKREGINRSLFIEKYNLDYEQLFQVQLMKLKNRGLIEDTTNGIRLTDEGLLLGNEVFEQFLAVLNDVD
ncbi:coproporphyrinogen III oxidase [Alkalihalobacillus alcalophilus ATCC 27647 = CGMCC 1.3604]|uniref:Heme chaperone HemW n=1 Tax=Alkalihalobacillus alcalophilus ATCC 27647 = CGMCC 1.3604 TaxID=1218173 RepID=A0A094XI43_ALKAL|nr:radical SAM family heme chaperone HemW [Alkalihalobacillus alcalophilus]KGA98455.1 coproporphyrinogen III oxidase [Alkalihalobacillus alcalophilus ATCC 27647 = CGMCC 1.3604]MED1563337.1 radical SAM family heme chaperone HemW [Alkalihalobacillus alcalophilus]THG88525.1 coproporphyrinogen III oxidase [Alkalihalobacillus alcalophilus ATCC 27647 = CGMCC 1.3604]